MREFRRELVPQPKIETLIELPSGPLDIEIGCGVGWHPICYALAHPERHLVAIEHTREKFDKFRLRLKRHAKLSNLYPVHANAVSWVTHAVAENSVDRYFILYPNPSDIWHEMPFFGQLVRTLKPGGELILATNIESYALGAVKVVNDVWGMTLSQHLMLTQLSKPQNYPRTHFEKKYLLRGETCHDVRFLKG